MSNKTVAKLLALALGAASLLSAANVPEAPVSEPWVETLAVLILSFGVAAIAGYAIDVWFRTRERAQPGVDAYIDQILLGNGSRLRRRER